MVARMLAASGMARACCSHWISSRCEAGSKPRMVRLLAEESDERECDGGEDCSAVHEFQCNGGRILMNFLLT